jgi:hypothetical protein
MGRILKLLLIMLCPLAGMAQDFSRAEYFFDADPGAGSGTTITLSSTASPVTFTTSIPTSSLSPGFHHLGIRIKEQTGPWSNFEIRGFYVSVSTSSAPGVTAAEYFFDQDPGIGNGTNIPVTPGDVVNFTIPISASSLSTGFHFLAIRTKNSAGVWSNFEARGFYISAATTDASNIVAAEYFYDLDPGKGNGTSIPVTAGSPVNFTVSLPATGLAPGFHFLAIRTKDSTGKWGIFESRGFYVSGSTADASNIVAAEYFFDLDPGTGNATSIPITPGSTVSFTATLPVGGLSTGFHFLGIRTKGSDGKWGVFESRGFYVSEPLTVSNIVAVEYYFDTDPGIGNGERLAVNPVGPDITQSFTFNVPGALGVGQHFLFMRAQDSQGVWSEFVRDTLNIASCTPPAAPIVPDNSRCGAGTVTLTASGAAGSNIYHWYEDNATAVVLATTASFTTPILSANKSYFVSIYDPLTTCESSRVMATAQVTVLTKPELNVSGSISFCEGNSIFLAAPSGFSNYVWSNGSTTQQILATTSGNYFVQTGNGTCLSENSDTLSVAVITAPTKPVINVTGNTILCGVETAVLSAPGSFQYLWSTGATTQDITVSQAGSYSVSVRNSTGCLSPVSDPVAITTANGDATITQDGNYLIASTGATYQWFLNGSEIPGASGQVLEIDLFEFGVYAVEVTTGSCFSRSEDFIYLITSTEAGTDVVFGVAPNPVHETMIIHNGLQQTVKVKLVDALGKNLLQREVPHGKHEYDVSSIAPGVYFLIAEIKEQSKVIMLNKL